MSEPIVHKQPAVQSNPFSKHLADHVNAGAVAIESERAIAEAQGKLVIAKRFPRDQALAYSAIIDACRRPGLAEEACYSFPRGGQTVGGPSIRLAEMLAANWGNIDYGIRELSRKEGVSEMEAYCWDLQTNTMSSQKFTVRHIRDTKSGGIPLKDERDIYELTANMGGRRLRARILAIIPADLVQAAVDECSKTMAGSTELPIGDRIRNMVNAFSKLGIQPALIEKRVGHSLDAMTGEELADLRKIHNSLRDGVSKINDWFGDKAADEQIDGDPTPDRPAPKPRAPKGAKAIEVVVDEAAAATPEPAAPAKVEQPIAPFVPPPVSEPVIKPAEPAAITQRPLLNPDEEITVEAMVDEFKVLVGKRKGADWPYVTAAIVSPELRGQVSMTDNSLDAAGKPIAAWQLDQPVRITVRGKLMGSGQIVNIVKAIELIGGAAPEAVESDV